MSPHFSDAGTGGENGAAAAAAAAAATAAAAGGAALVLVAQDGGALGAPAAGAASGAEEEGAESAAQREAPSVGLELDSAIGVSGAIRDNVLFTSENEVVYPVGPHLCFTNTETLSTSFVYKYSPVGSLALSPDRTVLAMSCDGEHSDSSSGDVVYIIHVATHKVIRQLRLPDWYGKIASMAFNKDGRYLVTHGGAPGFDLVVWRWEGEKVMARCKAPSVTTRVRFHPQDTSIITASGPALMRIWKMSSNYTLKLHQLLAPKREAADNWVDHAWLDGKTMVALVESGALYVLQTDEAASEAAAGHGGGAAAGHGLGGAGGGGGGAAVRDMQLQPKATRMAVVQVIKLELRSEREFVRAETVAATSKGFVVTGSCGYVGVFDAAPSGAAEPFMLIKTFYATTKEHFSSLAVSPTGEQLMCYSRSNRLVAFPLGHVDMLFENEEPFRMFPFVQHKGPVTAVDVCWGPMPRIVTCGHDKMVRVINYATSKCEITYQIAPSYGDAVCAAIHPSGNIVVIAFKEHIRIYNVLLGELREQGCIFLKQCHCVRFSHGGQYLACSTNIVINVYATYSAKLVHTFAEHIGQVRDFEFSRDDSALCSVGFDGAVFTRKLDPRAGPSKLCHSFETCQLTCVAVNAAADRAAVAGSDGQLREVSNGQEAFALVFDKQGQRARQEMEHLEEHRQRTRGLLEVRLQRSATAGALAAAAAAATAAASAGAGAGGAAPVAAAGAVSGADVASNAAGASSNLRGSGSGNSADAGSSGGAGEEVEASSLGLHVVTEETITSLLLSPDENALLVGTSKGAIRVYRWPLSRYKGKHAAYKTHSGPVTQLRVNCAGDTLFSCSNDGTVFTQRLGLLIKAPEPEGGEALALARPAVFQPCKAGQPIWANSPDSVLVSLKEWNRHVQRVEELKKEILDQQSAHEYLMTNKDNEWMETVRNARAESAKAQAKERVRYEDLQSRHEGFVQKHIEEKQRMETDRVRVSQALENEYEKRLWLALRRADAKEEAIEALRQKTDELLVKQETQHVDEMNKVKESLAAEVARLQKRLKTCETDLKQERARAQEAMDQQAKESDLEILRLKGSAETAVERERQICARKQGQLVQERNKLDQLRSKVAAMKVAKDEDDASIARLEEQTRELQATLRRYEHNIEEREQSLRDKEKDILELRSSNKTLDNFRYVLDHRIEKLMEEKGPVQEHITKLEKHIKEMYDELVREFQQKKQQETALGMKDLKADSLAKELAKLKVVTRDRDREIAALQHTISTAARTSDTKKAVLFIAEAYQRQVLKEAGPHKAPRRDNSNNSGSSTSGGSSSSSSSTSNHKGGDARLDQVAAPDSALAGAADDADTPAKTAERAMDELLATDVEASIEEMARQREYVQRTVKVLQQQLRLAEKKLQDKTSRSVAENALLVAECNRLRKEGGELRLRNEELEGHKVELQRKLRKQQLGAATSKSLVRTTSTPAIAIPEKMHGDQEQDADTDADAYAHAHAHALAHRSSTSSSTSSGGSSNNNNSHDSNNDNNNNYSSSNNNNEANSSSIAGNGQQDEAVRSPDAALRPATTPARSRQALQDEDRRAEHPVAALPKSSFLPFTRSPVAGARPTTAYVEEQQGRTSSGAPRAHAAKRQGARADTAANISHHKGMVEQLLKSLDDANREIAMQRSQIKRLREQRSDVSMA